MEKIFKNVWQICSKKAFTLAEVLITLGVIGVTATMTLPSLINKIQDIQYDRARAKIFATIGEAGRLLVIQGDITSANNTKDFVDNYLSKKLKIIKTCNSSNLKACGLVNKFKKLNGTDTLSMPTTFAQLGVPALNTAANWASIKNNPGYAFVMANGYSVNIFYNPKCTSDTNRNSGTSPDYACFNAIYDINGLKNPNQVGKDIGFVTLFYPDETSKVVVPNPTPILADGRFEWTNAQKKCSSIGKEYFLPDKEELLSMAINGNLIGITEGGYWSSTQYNNDATKFWRVSFASGSIDSYGMKTGLYVRCVKR